MKTLHLLAIVTVSVVCHLPAAEPNAPQPADRYPDHEFLKLFVGEWERTTEMFFGPGKSETTKGTMTGHMIGNFWVVIDLKGEFGGQTYHGRATYGFDSLETKKYVGTFTDSMAPILWNYEGEADGNKLVLETEGPHPSLPGKFTFRNTWEFKATDMIVLTSEMEGRDGKMLTILKSTCRRRKPKQ